MLFRANEEPGLERSAMIVALYFFCALFFGVDVILEVVHEIGEGEQPSFFQRSIW